MDLPSNKRLILDESIPVAEIIKRINQEFRDLPNARIEVVQPNATEEQEKKIIFREISYLTPIPGNETHINPVIAFDHVLRALEAGGKPATNQLRLCWFQGKLSFRESV